MEKKNNKECNKKDKNKNMEIAKENNFECDKKQKSKNNCK